MEDYTSSLLSRPLGRHNDKHFWVRIMMMFGVTGYPNYVGELWHFIVYGRLWFPVPGEQTLASQLDVFGMSPVCRFQVSPF